MINEIAADAPSTPPSFEPRSLAAVEHFALGPDVAAIAVIFNVLPAANQRASSVRRPAGGAALRRLAREVHDPCRRAAGLHGPPGS